MQPLRASWWRSHGWYGIALLQPFLLLWFLVPWLSGRSIGNDYPVYAIEYQMELMLSVFHGSYPLYVPGFHHGQSAAALSLGGLHHPIAWVCAVLPGYWQGWALDWNTLFRLVTLGLAHACVWRLLRRLGLPLWLGWALSTLALYNLRMLDLFRFAATFEAWTGTFFLIAAAGWYWLDRRNRLAPLAVALASWWLLCSGHPQFAYFGALAAALFVLALPVLGMGTPSDAWPSPWHFWLRSAGWGALGVGLSLSMLVPFGLDFMAANTARVGREYDWACAYQDTLAGNVANLLLPLHGDVHGAFGGSSLLLVLLLLPLVRLFGLRLSRWVWPLLGLAVAVWFFMLGGRTPFHRWAWELMPFAKAFRVPGRLAQLLPVIFLLLGLLGWKAWERQGSERRVRWGLAALAGIALAVQVAAPWLWSWLDPQHTVVNPQQLRAIPWGYELAVVAVGAVSLAAFGLLAWRPRWWWAVVVLVLGLTAQTGLVLVRGTWDQARVPTPTWEVHLERKGAELKFYAGLHGAGLGMEQASVREHGQRGFTFHRELARLCHQPSWAEDHEEAYRQLSELSGSVGACVLEAQAGEPQPDETGGVRRVELAFAGYNRQVFAVETPGRAWLVVHHPWDGRWSATVDGRPVDVLRADGLEIAVPVSPGKSQVEIRYFSVAWLAGVLGSSLSLAILGLLASWRLLAGRRRLLAAALSVAVAVVLPSAWWASLYGGDSLGTTYSWQDGEVEIPILRPELVPPPELCRSHEGLQVPCSY